jgi:hypothetical protein
MNRLCSEKLIISLLVWFSCAPLKADTIRYLAGFDFFEFDTPGSTASVDTLTLTPFDSSLGTLDEVRVSINGNVTHTGQIVGLVPYSVNVELDFTGLGGQFFNFSSGGMEFINSGPGFNYAACNIAGCQPLAGPFIVPPTTFGLEFHFNRAFQELTGINQGFIDDFSAVGVNAAIPPPIINGPVSAFEESIIPLNLMDILMIRSVTGTFTSLITDVSGTMSITYDYTPNPVPLPAAVWLFGTALLGLFGFSKRRKKA